MPLNALSGSSALPSFTKNRWRRKRHLSLERTILNHHQLEVRAKQRLEEEDAQRLLWPPHLPTQALAVLMAAHLHRTGPIGCACRLPL